MKINFTSETETFDENSLVVFEAVYAVSTHRSDCKSAYINPRTAFFKRCFEGCHSVSEDDDTPQEQSECWLNQIESLFINWRRKHQPLKSYQRLTQLDSLVGGVVIVPDNVNHYTITGATSKSTTDFEQHYKDALIGAIEDALHLKKTDLYIPPLGLQLINPPANPVGFIKFPPQQDNWSVEAAVRLTSEVIGLYRDKPITINFLILDKSKNAKDLQFTEQLQKQLFEQNLSSFLRPEKSCCSSFVLKVLSGLCIVGAIVAFIIALNMTGILPFYATTTLLSAGHQLFLKAQKQASYEAKTQSYKDPMYCP